MTEPSVASLRRFHRRVAGMLDDPECTGDLLALGIAMARWLDVDRHQGMKANWAKFASAALSLHHRQIRVVIAGVEMIQTPEEAGGISRYDSDMLRRLLTADVRRYDHTKDPSNVNYWSVTCGAPMIRRKGPCGQSATDRRLLVDHDTGREQYAGTCSRPDHKRWMQETYDRNRRGEDRPAAPRPMANTGGVLERHLPEIDWHRIYRWVDKNWTPPPEHSPWKRPKLTVHEGGGRGAVDVRPDLMVVPGQGEDINIDGDAS